MANVVKFQPLPATKFFTNGFFDEFFNRGVGELIGNDSLVSQPAVNVSESTEAFHIDVAAPGFDKPDFTLNIENGYLVVTAKREEKTEENNEKNRFLRREFRYESFKRSFKLPNSVNQDAISAVYEKGLLHIALPKKEEAKPVSKTIQIV
ncbi:MAG: Hsp20/alpha crystallin family protein [Saprospiraceae bacterium]|nr:Hsp20/alpha crystallin family protein [Saprospiraceae bacterium]